MGVEETMKQKNHKTKLEDKKEVNKELMNGFSLTAQQDFFSGKKRGRI